MSVESPRRSLGNEFGPSCWKSIGDPIFRCWVEGTLWGFPFSSLSVSRYVETQQELFLEFPIGTVVVSGPKALSFYDGFAAEKATLLRADGKDIVDVQLRRRDEESGLEQ